MVQANVQSILDFHGLGHAGTIARATRGVVNHTLIVNDQYVLRINRMEFDGPSRYYGEKLAYESLQQRGVPVPEVIAVDASRSIIPQDYMIMSKLPGIPVVDAWADLSAPQREHIALESGRYLALIHDCTFERFGSLRKLRDSGFGTLTGYLSDYFERYARWGLRNGALDESLQSRIAAVLEKHSPLLNRLRLGHLVHRDYHFENILQQDGVLAGIIDFEWSASGDPACDFAIDDQWEIMCSGSTSLILAGYTRQRKLDDDHALRLQINRILKYLEFAVEAKDNPADEATYRYEYGRVMAALESVEAS